MPGTGIANENMTDDEMETELANVFTNMADIFVKKVRTCSEQEKDDLKEQLQDPDAIKALLDFVSEELDSFGGDVDTLTRSLGDF